MARRPAIVSINGEKYYSAGKSVEILGISHGGLYYQVQMRNIHTEKLEGARQSYYRAKDVDHLATIRKNAQWIEE
jgi:hypothetical protein